MQTKYFYLLIPLVLLILFFAFWLKTNSSNKITPYNSVTIEIGNTKINAELADTASKRELGLSGRKELKDNEGMLFVFSEGPQYRVFWMKDMLIPIDIIWIRGGKILKVDANLEPPKPNTPNSNLTQYASPEVVEYVLEVPAGFSERMGIKAGDDVEIKM